MGEVLTDAIKDHPEFTEGCRTGLLGERMEFISEVWDAGHDAGSKARAILLSSGFFGDIIFDKPMTHMYDSYT